MRKGINMLFVLVVGFLALTLTSSSDSTDLIYWDKHSPLSWSDFEGHPRYEFESISAITSSGIMHFGGCEDGKLIYKINAYFEKKESWVKKEALTDHHLIHEQIHFDITELYARRLKKILSQRTFTCEERSEFERIISNTLELWQNEQNNYDILTRHSMDKEEQLAWFYRIQMEISLLDAYKSEIEVPLK